MNKSNYVGEVGRASLKKIDDRKRFFKAGTMREAMMTGFDEFDI